MKGKGNGSVEEKSTVGIKRGLAMLDTKKQFFITARDYFNTIMDANKRCSRLDCCLTKDFLDNDGEVSMQLILTMYQSIHDEIKDKRDKGANTHYLYFICKIILIHDLNNI